MSKLQQLIEKDFLRLTLENSPLHRSQTDCDYSDTCDRDVEQVYERLKGLIVLLLLKNQLKLSDMSRENRINCLETSGYFGIAAHRYASDSGDITYLTEVLSIMYEDAAYGAMNGIINKNEFHALICQWLNYFDYDKIEFKGDKNFERYFQEQKEKHGELFEAFGL
ncbi:hypothetical protein [Streptococcus agalactiae]|uniref:hypothetical protein n=1 Tax=Streptococcus agalactiae TaxID=1311 RepID=UPI00021A1532|nr:hypothetical protein [Streptococcus agalactiae]EGS27571.1 hypothetical protein FSLSAGS3026_06070 [Streptococcus agalactiae FSL S3-026]